MKKLFLLVTSVTVAVAVAVVVLAVGVLAGAVVAVAATEPVVAVAAAVAVVAAAVVAVLKQKRSMKRVLPEVAGNEALVKALIGAATKAKEESLAADAIDRNPAARSFETQLAALKAAEAERIARAEMDKAMAEEIAKAIQNVVCLPTTVWVTGDGDLRVKTKGGERLPGLGGWVGGDNYATLERGSMFWRETYGRIPYPSKDLYEILRKFGWFEKTA